MPLHPSHLSACIVLLALMAFDKMELIRQWRELGQPVGLFRKPENDDLTLF